MNKTEERKLTEWNDQLSTNYYVNDVFLGIYLILGISGNAVVIINYSFRMNNKKDDRYFIPFLAILDLFACGFRSSLELAMNVNPVNFKGSALCKFVWFPTNAFAIASIVLLLVIAVQRYLKICRPFGRQMTTIWKRVSLVACVVVGIIFSVPLIVYNDEIKVINPVNNVTGYVCDIDVQRYYGICFITYTAIATISSVAIMILLVIFNSLIGRTIYYQIKAKQRRSLQCEINRHKVESTVNLVLMNIMPDISDNMLCTQGETSRLNNSCTSPSYYGNGFQKPRCMSFAHRYSFMFMAIGLAFIFSYVPRMVILAISLKDPKFFGKISKEALAIVAFSREMNVVNNVANPFIYGFFDRKFRVETKHLLCCK